MRWLFLLLLSFPAFADTTKISVEIPRMSVAEYHKPYVAIWLENPEGQHLQTIALWYDASLPNAKGKEWLKDLRQWWRKYGRQQSNQLDGFTGATKAPGIHVYEWPHWQHLAAGNYVLVVEAAREVGGREMQKLAFTWPLKAGETLSVQGQTELARIQLSNQ